jgi:hypothetical protein
MNMQAIAPIQNRNNMQHKLSRILVVVAIALDATLGVLQTLSFSILCADSCPVPAFWVGANQARFSASLLIPFFVVEAFAIVVFWFYCMNTAQIERVVKAFAMIVVLGLVGVALLYGLIRIEQTQFPLSPAADFDEGSLINWSYLWGWSVTLVVSAWAYLIMRLIWLADPAARATPNTTDAD